ncbi:MAG: hypothetical protein QOF62_2004 [Pyrinomonadaceae bacterium]|jgi:hypothetical protein|nr:hypothetical protein [Pyrinomonadaceae bacterium]
MTENWEAQETNTHQDHVIAHVIGATVIGYFIFDETLHVLLDIGFVWNVFVDGEMGLLPHPVATAELAVSEQTRGEIAADIDNLLAHKLHAEQLRHLTQPQVECVITEVNFFASGDRRRLVVTGEDANLTIETSIETAEIRVYEF